MLEFNLSSELVHVRTSSGFEPERELARILHLRDNLSLKNRLPCHNCHPKYGNYMWDHDKLTVRQAEKPAFYIG